MSGAQRDQVSPELLATMLEFLSSRRDARSYHGHRRLLLCGVSMTQAAAAGAIETQFMSTANPTGFEFVRDAQGKVTHLMGAAQPETKRPSAKAPSVPAPRR